MGQSKAVRSSIINRSGFGATRRVSFHINPSLGKTPQVASYSYNRDMHIRKCCFPLQYSGGFHPQCKNVCIFPTKRLIITFFPTALTQKFMQKLIRTFLSLNNGNHKPRSVQFCAAACSLSTDN